MAVCDAMKPWVLDLDGVVWIGSEPIAGAADAVAKLRAAGERVVFVTNMSAYRVEVVEQRLGQAGIDATGAVITSAMAAASLVSPGERVLVVGGDGIDQAVAERGAVAVAPSDPHAAACDAVVVGMHPGFHYEDLSVAMTAIRAGARLIGCNHDPSYPTPQGLRPGGGSLVHAVAYAAEVEPVFAGKPHRPVADLTRQLVGADGIMVGDRPDSDGLFAHELGYSFALVLSGVTDTAAGVEPKPDLVAADLAELVDTVLGDS